MNDLRRKLVTVSRWARGFTVAAGWLALAWAAGVAARADEAGTPPAVKVAPGEIVENSLGMRFAYIPPGEFWMGSPENEPGRSDRETRRRVRLTRGYYLGVHEVTQAVYERVMGENPSHWRGAAEEDGAAAETPTPVLPVDSVDWAAAVEFCRRLSELPEEQAAGRRYRLPTEAEWERACRASTETPWSFGAEAAELQHHANYRRRGGRAVPLPVGSLRPNPWGLCDMHGNHWEWCADWLEDLPLDDDAANAPLVDPAGPREGVVRVVRGGSYSATAAKCRSATRVADPPEVHQPDIGIRVLLEAR